jgi:hypothetical protein
MNAKERDMGAEPYWYFVDYEEDVQAALDKLRVQVFESGEYNGAEFNPSTPAEALEMAEEEGTRSILDIMRIAAEPDFFCAAPWSEAELEAFFGTRQPTAEMVEGNHDLWDSLDRGMARYAIIYEGDEPSQIFFAGYSFD